MDVSWRTLKRKLACYDAGERALGVDLTRRFAALEVDLEQKTVRGLNSTNDVQTWMRRLLGNSCSIYCQVESIRVQDRTFMYQLQPCDILDVMRSIVDKIETMCERPEAFDWECEKEFNAIPVYGVGDRLRLGAPYAAHTHAATHAGLTALLGRLRLGAPAGVGARDMVSDVWLARVAQA